MTLKFIFFTAFLSSLYFAFTPLETPVIDDVNDKYKHVLAFFVLTLCLLFSWPIRYRYAFLIMLIYAVLIEVVQFYLPNRFSDINDVIADVGGVLLAISLIVLVRYFGEPLRIRVEVRRKIISNY